MSNILLLNQPFVCVAPGSFTYTIPATGQYSVEVQITENPITSCVLTISKNASTFYTSPTITPTQIAQQMKVGFQAAATDAIVVTLTSAAAIDNQKNTVKWTATLYQGF